MTNVAFTNSESHTGTPYSTLIVSAPPGISGPQGYSSVRHVGAIVDTGAAVSQFPEELARDIGLDPAQGLPVRLVTAGGLALRRRLTVNVEVFGIPLVLQVDFGPNIQPLIGRNAIEAGLKTLGYTARDLLYEH